MLCIALQPHQIWQKYDVFICKEEVLMYFLIYRAASYHCTEYMDDTHIILFGGTCNQNSYIFDTVTETWSDGPRQPDFSYVTGDYHNMCSSLKNGLVFGGRSGVDSRFTLIPAGSWVEG